MAWGILAVQGLCLGQRATSQFPLAQIQLFGLLYTAFPDAFERSPKLEPAHQAALPINKIASC